MDRRTFLAGVGTLGVAHFAIDEGSSAPIVDAAGEAPDFDHLVLSIAAA